MTTLNPIPNKIVPACGKHLIIEMMGAHNLQDIALCKQAFIEGVKDAGATLLDINIHPFKTDNMPEAGFSGMAILAESHISVHTWPENDYAAFDIFMCGDAEPEKALAVLKKHFKPEHCHVTTIIRGPKGGMSRTIK